MTRLQFNPEPIKVVPDAQREVWTRPQGWRCDHEDGRGRCTSRETHVYWNAAERRSETFCAKHFLAAPFTADPKEET